MRLIDADALIMNLDDRYSLRDISREYRDAVVYELENAPTIVEFEGDINKVVVKGEEYSRIVKCKDCKYMTEHCDTDGDVYWTCSEWDSGTDYDGFCHLAERRGNDS